MTIDRRPDQSPHRVEPAIHLDSFPRSGRLAAVDYGTVRIGVAVCDPGWILASPLETVPADAAIGRFSAIATRERLTGWVVGLPIHADGNESDKSVLARRFAIALQNHTGLPVRLFDERFTTVDANRRLGMSRVTRKRKKQRIDAIAAQVLLESFLEASRYRDQLAGEPAGSPGGDGDSLDR